MTIRSAPAGSFFNDSRTGIACLEDISFNFKLLLLGYFFNTVQHCLCLFGLCLYFNIYRQGPAYGDDVDSPNFGFTFFTQAGSYCIASSSASLPPVGTSMFLYSRAFNPFP